MMNRTLGLAALLLVLVMTLPGVRGAASMAADRQASARGDRPDDVQAVATLIKMGLPLERDSSGHVRWIEAAKSEFNDEAMRCLPGFPKLEWLEIGGGIVTASGIAHLQTCSALARLYLHDLHLNDDMLAVLAGLRHLEALSLQRTGITGKALANLRATDTLKVLNLSGDEISDADMAQVARFTAIEVLALQNTKITGSGLGKLEGMTQLNVLNVSNCRIADVDLKHLTSMPNLRIVYASGCNLSSKAIDALKDILPMLAVFQ
ncbi:MAG TPA: hypothetical protein VE398_10175 [Acidobacteriota bacterium]|nr:hypothetical protein [Acidobacteriota bacterium]